MKIHALAAVLLICACSKKAPSAPEKKEDPPPAAAAHPSAEDCHKLHEHIMLINSEAMEKLDALAPDEREKALADWRSKETPDDTKECMAEEKKTIDCALAAKNMDDMEACAPPDDK